MLKKWSTFGGLRNSFEQPYGPACNCYAAIRNRENKQTKTKEMDMDINSRPYSSGRSSSKATWSFNYPESPGQEVTRLKGFIHHFTLIEAMLSPQGMRASWPKDLVTLRQVTFLVSTKAGAQRATSQAYEVPSPPDREIISTRYSTRNTQSTSMLETLGTFLSILLPSLLLQSNKAKTRSKQTCILKILATFLPCPGF